MTEKEIAKMVFSGRKVQKAGKKMSKAPTPIEVSMNQYVKDENQAMIDSVECMPRCVRNNYPGATKC